MLRNEMVEKNQGFAELEDVDPATFVRFLEWLYRGYYHAALPVQTITVAASTPKLDYRRLGYDIYAPIVLSTPRGLPSGGNNNLSLSALTEAGSMDAREGLLSRLIDAKAVKKPKKRKISENTSSDVVHQSLKQDARQNFTQRKYAARQTLKSLSQPRQNWDAHDDYSEVFLCHVYLYVFADKYDIQPLKILALEELHATLVKYTLYPERVQDIVRLLHYVYANAPEQANKTEDLRTMMKQYVECEIDTMLKDDGLGEHLMGTERAILGDIFKIVSKRLARANPFSSFLA